MNVKLINEPFPHAVIDNLYTEDELKLIWRELDFLTSDYKLSNVDTMVPSIDYITKIPNANNTGLNMDEIYGQRNVSDILTLNRKIFNSELVDKIISMSPLLSHLEHVDLDYTKIRYYDNGEEYNPHHDSANFTFCTYFYKDESLVEGGELYFPKFDYEIETINNRCVFFVGGIMHGSKPSKRIGEWRPFDGYGRYCMNQFLRVKD